MDLTGAALRISDRSGVGGVRRAAAAVARELALDEDVAGRVAIVATELATNLIKHAGEGWCFVAPSEFRGGPAVSIAAVDAGPGIANPATALADGFSTAGTPGTGLGAVRRLSLTFDLYSRSGQGVVAAARVGPQPVADARPEVDAGAVLRAKPGEQVAGDVWAIRRANGRVLVLVADGLGHGPAAHAAAGAAAAAFRNTLGNTAMDAAEAVHSALRGTRGAAIAVASIETAAHRVVYAGIGNIAGRLILPDGIRSLVSMNGTAGLQARSLRAFEYEAPPGALLVLHSDGVSARWNLEDYPGLHTRDPTLIAAVLFRDFGRPRDDAAVVVLRTAGAPIAAGESAA